MFPVLRNSVADSDLGSAQSLNASAVGVVQYSSQSVQTTLLVHSALSAAELERQFSFLVSRAGLLPASCELVVKRVSAPTASGHSQSQSQSQSLAVEICLSSALKGEASRAVARIRAAILADSSLKLFPSSTLSSSSVSALLLPGGLVARRQSSCSASAASAVDWEVLATGRQAVQAYLLAGASRSGSGSAAEALAVAVAVVCVSSAATAELLGVPVSATVALARATQTTGSQLVLVIMEAGAGAEAGVLMAGLWVAELPGYTGASIATEPQTALVQRLSKVNVAMAEQQGSVRWSKPILLYAISGLLNGYVLQLQQQQQQQQTSGPTGFCEYLNFALDAAEFQHLKTLTTAVHAVRLRDVKTWLVALVLNHVTAKYSAVWLARVLAAEEVFSDGLSVDKLWEQHVQAAQAAVCSAAAGGAERGHVATGVRQFRHLLEGGLKADELARTLRWKLEQQQPQQPQQQQQQQPEASAVYAALLQEAVQEEAVAVAVAAGKSGESVWDVQRVQRRFFAKGKQRQLQPHLAREVFAHWLRAHKQQPLPQQQPRRRQSATTTRTRSLDEEQESKPATGAVEGGCCAIS